jgi:hypothetical protein
MEHERDREEDLRELYREGLLSVEELQAELGQLRGLQDHSGTEGKPLPSEPP